MKQFQSQFENCGWKFQFENHNLAFNLKTTILAFRELKASSIHSETEWNNNVNHNSHKNTWTKIHSENSLIKNKYKLLEKHFF